MIGDNEYVQADGDPSGGVQQMKKAEGANDILSQMTATPTGDDKGITMSDQLCVEGEIIAGVDSYPVPLAFHCDEADTTGKVITSAVDVTAILQSDSASSTGWFGGTSTGKYLLIGSTLAHEGQKVKYDSLATVEPANIEGQAYLSDAFQWQAAPRMGTNANSPYEAHGWGVAVDNHTAEQIFFGYDPLTRNLPTPWVATTFNINGVDMTMFWSRILVTAPITGDPQVQQIKLHTNRIELEAEGIFKYGLARNTIPLPFEVVANAQKTPASENISYTSGFDAVLVGNELSNNAVDGFGIKINRVFGLDTSVPIVIDLSFYIKGANTGNIELNYEVSQVLDGFIYDGSEPFDSYVINHNQLIGADLTRFTMRLIADVSKLESNSAIVVNIYRDATGGNLNDTLAASVIRANVNVTGTSWKI
jgi:hypothetical protein